MLKIKAVEFAGASVQPGMPAPDDLAQVAFVGRSNVGKSSAINRFLGRTRSRIARVSAQPGRTQAIHYYRVTGLLPDGTQPVFFLVDLPGYGFARAPRQLRESWRGLVHAYLSDTAELRGVVQLVDSRHDPTREDELMVDRLCQLQVPVLVLATKLDKLVRSKRKREIHRIAEQLRLDTEQVVGFSAVTGEGRAELLGGVVSLLGKDGAVT